MIDTLETPRTLEKQGFTQSQAEALAHALKRAVTDEVPNKSDFNELRGDFSRLRGEFTYLREEFSGLRGEFSDLKGEFSDLKGEFSDLRGEFSDLKGEFSDLRDDFAVLRREFTDLKGTVNLLTWMVGVNMTLTLLVLGKLLLAGHP